MAVQEGSALCHVSSSEQVPNRKEIRTYSEHSAAQKSPFLCAPHYWFKIFRSKGAVLVLLWSFVGHLLYHFLTTNPDHRTLLSIQDTVINPVVIFTICMLLYPILGWLADVKYGRYRVIKCGLWTTWVMSILFCLVSATLIYFFPLNSSHAFRRHTMLALKVFLLVPASLGLGSIMANIFQFGIDQLVDASSGEITSFLRWFAWLWFLGGVVTGVSQSCLCLEYESLGHLVFPALITVAIAMDFMCGHWLVKEPASNNPLTLIFQVLRYAVKNKYPRQRSAFTYWEDKPYSRIDLAKDKYGGPFTTEQVEDVKTFFRIISVIVASTFFFSMFVSVYPVYGKVMRHLSDKQYVGTHPCDSLANCFQRFAVKYSGDMVLLIILPFFEFVLHPFFKRFFQISILRKTSIGMATLVLSLTICTAVEFVANHYKHLEDPEANRTCTLFNKLKDEPNSLPLDYKLMILPIVLNSFSQFFILISFGEFLCAQSPYSMKGFLFGIAFGFAGFFTLVGYGVMQSFSSIAKKWLSDGYGCMSWFLLMALVFLLITLAIFLSVFKCYKRRMRDDSEHNEQTFAVNYYSQCHDSTE